MYILFYISLKLLVPAPPPPIRPPPPVEPPRESFMAQRQDRDTFGVHQNRVPQHNSKRNSFSANWEVQTSMTQEIKDDMAAWAKDALDMDKHDGRNSRDSWNVTESTTASMEITRKNMNSERWDGDHKNYEKKSNKEPVERPTFRTHQLSKSAQEREKKLSVSTQNTERPDKVDVQEWPEFMRPIQTPPKSKSPVNGSNNQSSPKATSRLLPLGATACITYNRVSWLLRVRKEVFSPAEPLGPLPSVHLIFCQIVLDIYGITSCIRINQNERRAGMAMLSGYGVTADNLNSPHRAHIKRNIIELARTWPLYFARLFSVSGAAQVRTNFSLSINCNHF